jgi:hypothetical protein
VQGDAMSGQPAGVLACKGRSTFRCMSDGQRQCSPPRVVGSMLPSVSTASSYASTNAATTGSVVSASTGGPGPTVDRPGSRC